jgi:hypothetical protein
VFVVGSGRVRRGSCGGVSGERRPGGARWKRTLGMSCRYAWIMNPILIFNLELLVLDFLGGKKEGVGGGAAEVKLWTGALAS